MLRACLVLLYRMGMGAVRAGTLTRTWFLVAYEYILAVTSPSRLYSPRDWRLQSRLERGGGREARLEGR